LSKAQYVIQCVAIASGLLSFVFLRAGAAELMRQTSVICFVVGLALGFLVLANLMIYHRREVF
jgi:hypothetical protein